MKKKRVIIIGGGISGLSAAYRLHELSCQRGIELDVTVLEGSGRLGGIIRSERRDGFLLEHGADAFLAEKPWVVDLARRLGIEDKLQRTQSSMRRSFVLHHGKLAQVPEGFYLLASGDIKTLFQASFLSWPGRLRMACELFIPPSEPIEEDESVGSFVRRRFGREALQRIAQPMIGGIYTADPDQLSLQATFPIFQEMVSNHGSVMKAIRRKKQEEKDGIHSASGPRYSLFLSFTEGMEILVKTLIEKMPGVTFKTRVPVTRIEYRDQWKVEMHGREVLEADVLCLAIPAYKTAELLRPFAADVAQELDEIPYGSVATVNFGYKREDIDHPLNGFGFVVPDVERRNLLGCTFSSVKFSGRAPEEMVLLRAFVGGKPHQNMLELDDEGMGNKVAEELKQILGIRKPPVFVSISRFSRAMPQYGVGHLNRVGWLEKQMGDYEGLYLTGNAFRGVGIPDCIRQAEEIAVEIMNDLTEE